MYSCNPFWSPNTRLRKWNPSVCCRYLICSLSSTAFCSTYTVVILRTSPFGDCCAVPSSMKCKSCCHTYQPLPDCCCKFSLFYVEMEMEPKRHPGQLLRMAAVPLFWFGSTNAYPPIYGDLCISHAYGWFQLLGSFRSLGLGWDDEQGRHPSAWNSTGTGALLMSLLDPPFSARHVGLCVPRGRRQPSWPAGWSDTDPFPVTLLHH